MSRPRLQRSLRRSLFPVLLALLPAASGCQGAAPASARAPLRYAGSGTISDAVLPALAEGFAQRGGPRVEVVHTTGSSAGLRSVMDGKADLAGVSRSLLSAEKAQGPYYVILGYDALTVYVHPDNPVRSLTRAQLKALFTGKVKRWSEVGGADVPVEVVSVRLDTGSGTVDFFRTVVMEGAEYTPATRQFERPGDCTDRVAQSPGAVSVGTLGQRDGRVRTLAVDGAEPTGEAVRTADYPLSRALVLATRTVPQGALRDFLSYALSPEGQARVAQTFVPVRAGP